MDAMMDGWTGLCVVYFLIFQFFNFHFFKIQMVFIFKSSSAVSTIFNVPTVLLYKQTYDGCSSDSSL